MEVNTDTAAANLAPFALPAPSSLATRTLFRECHIQCRSHREKGCTLYFKLINNLEFEKNDSENRERQNIIQLPPIFCLKAVLIYTKLKF